MRFFGMLACLALLTTAPAAAQEWRQGREYDVVLNNFSYQPKVIRLKAGEPVRLRLINRGRSGLHFYAKDFFASARLRSRDAPAVENGGIKLAPGEVRVIALVPAPGRYRMRSPNIFHRLLGMGGKIIVE